MTEFGLLFYWEFFASIFIRQFALYFSYSVLFSFWYQDDETSLVKFIWWCYFPFSFLEAFVQGHFYFFKCLIKFTSELIWSCTSPPPHFGRVLIIDSVFLLQIYLFRYFISSWLGLNELIIFKIFLLFLSSLLAYNCS